MLGENVAISFKLPVLFDTESSQKSESLLCNTFITLQRVQRVLIARKKRRLHLVVNHFSENILRNAVKKTVFTALVWKYQLFEDILSDLTAAVETTMRLERRKLPSSFNIKTYKKKFKLFQVPRENVLRSMYLNKIQNGYTERNVGNLFYRGNNTNGILSEGELGTNSSNMNLLRTTYFGDFEANKMSGQGLLIKYQNSSNPLCMVPTAKSLKMKVKRAIKCSYLYKGEFRHGAKHGTGLVLLQNGDVVLAEFVRGKLTGRAFYHSSLADRRKKQFYIKGWFNNYIPHGRIIYRSMLNQHETGVTSFEGLVYNGIVTCTKKRCLISFKLEGGQALYCGYMLRTKACGNGFLFVRQTNSTLIYLGDFKYGLFNGNGILRKTNNTKVTCFNGIFRNGKYFGKGVLFQRFLKDDTYNILQGTFVDGVVEGEGQEYIKDSIGCAKFIGRYRGGQKHGLGKMTFAIRKNEIRRSFKGKFRHGQFSSTGTMEYINGNKCVGSFIDNLPHGDNCEMFFANGDKYIGGFKKGIFDGYGEFENLNGDYFKGTYEDGKKSGDGSLWLSGEKIYYSGTFVNNHFEGNGKIIFSPGLASEERYEGMFWKSMRHGFGIYFLSNGDSYEGEFKQNNRHGMGKMIYADSKKMIAYEGAFHEDKMQGKGVARYTDGSVFTGEFYGNNRTGIGKIRYENGDVFEGYFENDEPNGEGKLLYKNSNGELYATYQNSEIQPKAKYVLSATRDRKITLRVLGI